LIKSRDIIPGSLSNTIERNKALTQIQSYNDDMQALMDAIQVTYRLNSNVFKDLVVKYNDGFLGKPGQIEFEKMLGKHIIEVKDMISKSYIRKTLHKYYSDYGIISTIHDILKNLYLSDYDDLSRNF